MPPVVIHVAAKQQKRGVTVKGKKYKIAIKYYDDESTPARGAQLVERLINQNKVTFYGSGSTKAMAPITGRSVKVKSKTIIMVEQNAKQGQEFANPGYVLVSGVLTLAGKGSDLIAKPEVEKFFLGE